MKKRTIKLSDELVTSVEAILAERNVTLAEVVSLYLRAMVNSIENGKALGLDSIMPFGKYRGETIGVIAAGDPGYLRYLMAGERPTQFEAAVLERLK